MATTLKGITGLIIKSRFLSDDSGAKEQMSVALLGRERGATVREVGQEGTVTEMKSSP